MSVAMAQPNLIYSKISLCAVLVVPLLMTIHESSQQVNLVAELFQLVFILVMLPETIRCFFILIAQNKLFRWLVLSIGFLYFGWFLRSLPIFDIYRTFHYPVYLFFFTALVSWFKKYGCSGFLFISTIKISATVFALVYLFSYICFVLPPSNYIEAKVFVNPPIYNHLRHMNYDMAFSIALMVFGYCKGSGWKKNVYLFLLFFCGFFTVWSAARGQTLSFLLYIILIVYFKLSAETIKKLIVAVSSLMLGGGCVFLTDYTFYINLRNNLPVTDDPVNTLSSDRLHLWGKVVDTFIQNEGWWVGLGPDAWVRSKVIPGSSQTHNFILQWLIEFGVPVTLLLLLIVCKSVSFSMSFRSMSCDLSLQKTVAALLLSTFAYALIDGQFYHALPFSMILIMGAYLFSKRAFV